MEVVDEEEVVVVEEEEEEEEGLLERVFGRLEDDGEEVVASCSIPIVGSSSLFRVVSSSSPGPRPLPVEEEEDIEGSISINEKDAQCSSRQCSNDFIGKSPALVGKFRRWRQKRRRLDLHHRGHGFSR